MKYIKVLLESINDEKDIKVKTNASSGVIVREDANGIKEVLLIQRSPDDHWPHHWEFPRGKCDNGKNEDVKVCAKREIKEETGLDVEIDGLVDTFQYLADEGTRLTTCYNYICHMKNPNQTIKLSQEHQDYKWISEVGEAEMLVLPDQKKTLEKVLSGERPIVTYPDNNFTKNNRIDEILRKIQC